MTHTHFHQDLDLIVKNRAYSYSKTNTGFANAPLNYANVGATSLFTSATDLTKWLDHFREPVIGGKAAIARQQEQAVLSDGKKIDYALGVSIGKYSFRRRCWISKLCVLVPGSAIGSGGGQQSCQL
jgi:hypothetical protein